MGSHVIKIWTSVLESRDPGEHFRPKKFQSIYSKAHPTLRLPENTESWLHYLESILVEGFLCC